MKIGVISDIHGNHHALKKVLQCARKENVNELLILGDFVGYYYHPDKVMDLLNDWKFYAIQGNHEELLAGLIDGKFLSDDIKKKYGSGHDLAIQRLSSEQMNFLTTLPVQLRLEIDGLSLLLSHGSPWDKNQYLYPDCEKEVLDKCDLQGIDFVLVGHSHYSFCRKSSQSILINVGSVGQSRNQSGLAQWTIIDTSTNVFEMRATPYDVTDLVAEVETTDPDNLYLKEVLIRNVC